MEVFEELGATVKMRNCWNSHCCLNLSAVCFDQPIGEYVCFVKRSSLLLHILQKESSNGTLKLSKGKWKSKITYALELQCDVHHHWDKGQKKRSP